VIQTLSAAEKMSNFTMKKFPMKFTSHMRNLGQIMDIIPELFRALEENLGLYKHENTLVLFLSIFPERY
jgi:hypothetical protein